MLMQNFGVTNKEHYGMLWYFLEWSIQSWPYFWHVVSPFCWQSLSKFRRQYLSNHAQLDWMIEGHHFIITQRNQGHWVPSIKTAILEIALIYYLVASSSLQPPERLRRLPAVKQNQSWMKNRSLCSPRKMAKLILVVVRWRFVLIKVKRTEKYPGGTSIKLSPMLQEMAAMTG